MTEPIPPALTREDAIAKPIRPPTYRQAQIARLVAYGWGYKQIGGSLGIAPETVRRHIAEIALLIPTYEDGEHPELFTPYNRVLAWAVWEYRIRPSLTAAA